MLRVWGGDGDSFGEKVEKQKQKMSSVEKFWNNVSKFPLYRYCEEYQREYWAEILIKDCSTCRFLQFGKCSKNRIPKLSAFKEANKKK